MLYACAARFDLTGNFEKFLVFGLIKQGHSIGKICFVLKKQVIVQVSSLNYNLLKLVIVQFCHFLFLKNG